MNPENKTVAERFFKNLELILGVPANAYHVKLNCSNHQVVIRDAHLFHEIAKAAGIREIKRGKSSSYSLNMQQDCQEPEHWLLTLSLISNQDFLRNYGGSYKFV